MSANTILQYEISRIPLVVLTQGGVRHYSVR